MEWAAYFEIEPPENAADWRNAQLIATLARLKGQRVKAADFMPIRRKRRQNTSEQIATFRALTG